jgi:uncharacterized Zn finger protein (UPF0148 family)
MITNSKLTSAQLYELQPKHCKRCKSVLPVEKRKNIYCGHSCAASITNSKRQRTTASKIQTSISLIGRSISLGARKKEDCKECGLPFYMRIKKPTVFCSGACYKVNLKKNEVHPTASTRNWRKKKKLLAVTYKGGKCELCGYSKCFDALHFHHKDPNEKAFSPSGGSISWERMRNEIDKCALLCANCHSEVHAGLVSLK